MAKRVKKTKTMSEAIKPTLKKAPKKKAAPKKTVTKKATTKTSTAKKSTTNKVETKKTAPKKRVTASTGRKRTTKKPVVKKPVVAKKPTAPALKVVNATKEKKRTINDNRYIKVSTNSKSSKFVEMGQKVQRGEVKWVYFTTENDIGYHYYLKLKQK